MEILLLAGVIAFLAIMTVIGYAKGFIKIVLSLAVTIVALLASVLFAGPCSSFIKNHTPIYNTVKEQMANYVSEYIGEGLDNASKEIQEEAIKKLNLPSSIQDKLIVNNTDGTKSEMKVESFSNYVVESLTDILLNAVTVLVLFLIFKILLRVLVSVVDLFSKLPVVNFINKNLGAVIGFVEGILIIWVICTALTAVSGTKIGEDIFSAIASNPVLNFIYNHNLLTKYIL